MKRGSTILLRAAVLVFGLIVLVLCVYAVPAGILNDDTGYYKPILWGLYGPALPFFYTIYQSMKILDYIDKNKAFSDESVTALKRVKYCAAAISGLFTLGFPYIFYVGDRDDAPGVILLALIIISTSFVIAATAAMLQRLVQHGVDLKAENDLTV